MISGLLQINSAHDTKLFGCIDVSWPCLQSKLFCYIVVTLLGCCARFDYCKHNAIQNTLSFANTSGALQRNHTNLSYKHNQVAITQQPKIQPTPHTRHNLAMVGAHTKHYSVLAHGAK